MTTNSTLNWNKKPDGNGYWATSPAGDELVIWGRSDNSEGFTLNVNGEVPVHAVKLATAKAVAEDWVEAHLPQIDPVTAGAWSIDDAGNLWKDGEYVGRIVEQDSHGYASERRTFYAQGVEVTGSGNRHDRSRKYISIGSSSARNISVEDHAALSAKVAK